MSDLGDAAVAECVLSSPPRVARTAPDGSVLQSTPSNPGLAAVSGQLETHGVLVADLAPRVVADVSKAQMCEADVMLEYILRRASQKPDDSYPPDSRDLLDRCLKEVVPICNGQGAGNKSFPGGDITKALKSYTECEQETDLYAPFVQASNIALAHLKELKIEGMREKESGEVGMFFQRNDPKIIHQNHAGHNSERKPDVVVLPFEEVSSHFSEVDSFSNWNEYVGSRHEKPPTASAWKDVLSVFEFKRSRSAHGMEPPPNTYSRSVYRAPKRKFLQIGKDGNELNEAEPQKVPVAEQAEPADPALPRRSIRSSTQKNTQESLQSSLKRQAQADSESHASKRAKTEEPKSSVTAQTALYAAEMQSANIAVKHIFNFIVIGDDIWIWYYDHQGLIGVGGFNFVQDLPRYLVLLYALQRFNLEDWGRNTAFMPNSDQNDVTSYTVKANGHVLTLDNNRVTRFGLAGRGTDVMDATCETLKREKAAEETEGGMVAKIYWGEEARVSEEDILKDVMEVAQKHEVVQGHVPVLLLAKKFPVSTSTIRKALGLKNPEEGSRTLFLLVFKKLSPIKQLQGDDLLKAWRECVLCHYVLWKFGIHHRDVSCENLMYYRRNGEVIGVLNDYDLASLASSDKPLGKERTGTMPFMAIDLLDADGRDGKVKHLYRHDMESFIWVFVWICHQFMDGKLRSQGPLDAWAKVDASGCVKEKRNFLIATLVAEDVAHVALVYSVVFFLNVRHNVRYNSTGPLALAKRQLRQGSDLTASQRAVLNQQIEALNKNLVEQSDEVVFREFATVIGLDTRGY